MRRFNPRQGFTLVEVMVATVIIGIAISAMVGANAYFTRVNGAGVDLTQAGALIDQIREMTLALEISDLAALDGQVFSPPIDSAGTAMTELGAYSQAVTVEHVLKSDLSGVDSTGASPFVRVTVRVLLNGCEVASSAWIRAED